MSTTNTNQIAMKTKNFLVFLIVISFGCHAQDMAGYKIDNNVSILLPTAPKSIDTLGVRRITAQTTDGLILVMTTLKKDKSIKIGSRQDLVEFYDGCLKGIIKSSGGTLIQQGLVFKNNLQLHDFSFSVKKDGLDWTVNCVSLFLDGQMYSFQNWQAEDYNAQNNKSLLKEIKLAAGFGQQNQLTSNTVAAESDPLGKSTIVLLIIILLVGVAHQVIKRYRSKKTV